MSDKIRPQITIDYQYYKNLCLFQDWFDVLYDQVEEYMQSIPIPDGFERIKSDSIVHYKCQKINIHNQFERVNEADFHKPAWKVGLFVIQPKLKQPLI